MRPREATRPTSCSEGPVTLSVDPATDARLQERFRQAALIAGFEEVDFVFEPVAASVNYADRVGDVVLVFDFGGGTLDISLARTRSDGIEILASAGADPGRLPPQRRPREGEDNRPFRRRRDVQDHDRQGARDADLDHQPGSLLLCPAPG